MEKHEGNKTVSEKVENMTRSELISSAIKCETAKQSVKILLEHVEGNNEINKHFLIGAIEAIKNFLEQ